MASRFFLRLMGPAGDEGRIGFSLVCHARWLHTEAEVRRRGQLRFSATTTLRDSCMLFWGQNTRCLCRVDVDFAEAIDCFILYLATERGLSENYQLLTRRSLEKFADWAGTLKGLSSPREVELEA